MLGFASPKGSDQPRATERRSPHLSVRSGGVLTSVLLVLAGLGASLGIGGSPAAAAPPTGAWTQLSPATSPPALQDAAMAYDPATSQLVLFGGDVVGVGLDNDTWIWNGATWTELSPATSPPARAYASMAYDPATSQLVLFGGNVSGVGLENDTWNWNGATWTELSPATSPPAREDATMAYDVATSQLLLFGGAGNFVIANNNSS
jgi:hypothetical protein